VCMSVGWAHYAPTFSSSPSGDEDERVVPFHSYKYVTTLQTTVGCNANQVRAWSMWVFADEGRSLWGHAIWFRS